MPQQDTTEIKEKIKNYLKNNGPSLPIRLAKEINVDTLFASAFLSELISDREIKTSNMKVGNSSLYFLPGQEQKLENFSQYLKSKEKEAFELLKQKKFLKDSEQEPAIRVALRAIKDFAIPFKKQNEIIWRYFSVPESEFQEVTPKKESETSEKIQEKIEKEKQEEDFTKEPEKESIQESKEELNIFDKEDEKQKVQETEELRKKQKPKRKKKRTNQNSKKSEKFFNRVKEYLSEKNIEILDIEGFSKNNLLLRIKDNEKQELLFAYNKKRITEQDIIKANKKASGINLPYKMISLGEPLKKLINLIDAVKNLSGIKKIE